MATEKQDDRKVSVLGTEYSILYRTTAEDQGLEDCNGYCDTNDKRIVIDSATPQGPYITKNMKGFKNKVLRHELIHAILYESGLNIGELSTCNESLVEWIAIQLPKIIEVCKETGCLG